MAREPKPKNQLPRPIALGSNPLSRLSVLDLIESQAQEEQAQSSILETSERTNTSILQPSTPQTSGRPNASIQRPSMPQISGRHENDVDGMPSTQKPQVDGMPSTPQTSGRPKNKTSGRPKGQTIDRHAMPKETIRLKPDIFKQISFFCLERGITKQELWEILAVHLLNKINGMPSTEFDKLVDGMPSHDDPMISQTTDDNIIMRYKELTGQPWTRRDDRDAKQFNGTDPRIIDLALVITIERKLRGNTSRQPIKSFAYFKPEIELLLEQQKSGDLPATLSEYHRYVMSAWDKRIKPVRDEKWGPNKNDGTNGG